MTVHVVAAGHNAYPTACFFPPPPQLLLILLGDIMCLSSIEVVCKDME